MAHVDADEVAALLADDGVDGDGRLAGGTVADDELALAAADGDHGVDSFDAGEHGRIHALAHDHVGSDALYGAGYVAREGALAIQGVAQRVHHSPDEGVAHGHLHDAAGGAHLIALADLGVVAEDHGADGVLLQVQGQAHDLVGELEDLVVHGALEAVHAGDAVAGLYHRADIHRRHLHAKLLDLLANDGGYLFRSNRHVNPPTYLP